MSGQRAPAHEEGGSGEHGEHLEPDRSADVLEDPEAARQLERDHPDEAHDAGEDDVPSLDRRPGSHPRVLDAEGVAQPLAGGPTGD